MSIRVAQLNMLASLWVGEQYRQFPCYSSIVSSSRLTKTLKYLETLNADVYVLCEVEHRSLKNIKKHFGRDYSVMFTSNRRGFWSEDLDGKEWVENGTCIITARRDKINNTHSFIDLADGCMATVVNLIYATVISVHFDTGPRKYLEADTLLKLLKHNDAQVTIISGDFNMISTREFEHVGYVGASLCNEHTTILLEGVIDHTLVRGARSITSKVLHPSFDDNDSVVRGISNRLCHNPNGSDHYATLSTINL